MVANWMTLKSILLSMLVVACVLTPCWGMDGLDLSQAKVLDMIGTWYGPAADDVLQRSLEYLPWPYGQTKPTEVTNGVSLVYSRVEFEGFGLGRPGGGICWGVSKSTLFRA